MDIEKLKQATIICLQAVALFIFWLTLLFLFSSISYAAAEQPYINIPILADAIYQAEGGANTNHPYGILQKYKSTTPRQACINTINSALKRWDGAGDFISFLGSTYAPTVNATNDPTGLNRNWIKNVKFFYNKFILSSGE